MAKHLVIVESPAKAKTLKKFLGPNYKIEASMGHVRDLPKSALGIETDNDFEPKYITIRGKGDLLKKLRKEVKDADKVYLATDPDREGEAISWHLYHALNLSEKPTERITFNEITKNAVKKSIKEAREIDMTLVNAQQARRQLDRIVGYKISPLLWAKVKKGLSAGRVQSVLMKIICDREDEINGFIPQEYWTIEALFETKDKKRFEAKFHGINDEKTEISSKNEADEILAGLSKGGYVISEIKKSNRVRKPYPPFTTSTLQQEASKHLNFTTAKTMQVAQQLYEGVDITGQGTLGLITYMRTDSVRVSDEAFAEVKAYIIKNYGEQYSSSEKNEYKSKGRTQDAHEAIRPTYAAFSPDTIKDSLSREQLKLYTLIWERFVASQMTPALYDTISVKIANGKYLFRATGSTLKFSGFLHIYKKDDEEKSAILPELSEGENLKALKITPEQHFTQPPPRFTEAMIVKTLEENGVGRPSTYAPTIATVITRGYVTKEAKVFYPTELGEVVNSIMENNFEDIVNIDFTSDMESALDAVEEGKTDWKDIIRQFYPYFIEKLKIAEEKIGRIEVKDQESDVNCDICGLRMVIKMGRFGKFLACPGFPDCRKTLPYFEDTGVKCPKCQSRILIKKTKKGRTFYACENGESCDFMSWAMPTGKLCPRCKGALTRGKKHIVCSNSQCGYKTEAED